MKYLLYTSFILLFVSCAKEEVDPADYTEIDDSEQLILNKNEGEISEDVVNTIEMNRYITTVDDSYIGYDISVPNKEAFQVGKIIIGNPSSIAPFGFLRKIEAIQETNSEIILSTSESNLLEAFDFLSIDARYVTVGNSVARSGSIKKVDLGLFPIKMGADNVTFDIKPSFGMTGDFVFEIEIDQSSNELRYFKSGIENLVLDFEVLSSFYGTIESEGDLGEVILPFKFSFSIPIGQWIIIINTRLVINGSAEINSSGGFEIKTSIQNQPFDVYGEIDPVNYPNPPHTNYVGQNAINSVSAMGFEHEFTDVQGSIEASVGLTLALQMSPYNQFETIGSAFIEAKFLNFRATAETKTVEDKLQATTKLDIFSSLAIGTDILEKIWEKANLWSKPPELKLESPELIFPLDEEVFCFPCTVQFDDSHFDASCVGADLNRVKMDFRIDSENGSENGFELFIDNESFGTYAYNQNHTRNISALRLNNYSDIVLKDTEKTGCRLNFKVTNPCDLKVNCDGAPLKDTRDDQEYCFLNMADGKTWLASNLLYSDNGTTGVCHENMPDRCLEFGRYYTFNELNDESGGICPAGYHVPSKDEWFDLLQAEKNSFGRVPHLIAPYFTKFGDYPPEQTTGFNIVPAGQYQSWKFFEESGKKWSNSIYEDDEVIAFFWTSTPLEADSKSLFAEDGAKAISINSGGVYSEVRMPRTMGLPCRCIKNN